ncbi:MAG: UvrB/UvrC motif-containing protein [Gemmatimonadaceae bacterium]|nr:UvrB/UvrC motif-containing protein [Gemmatimonadaceae bacterium]
MLCDNCNERDAVVNLTTIENNAVRQLHLCEQCAAERGVETSVATPKHPLGEFLQAVQQQSVPASADAGKCTFCGLTMRDFRATGRMGCARCYVTFAPSMKELLRRVHGNARHTGRPYRAPADAAMETGSVLGELREKLRRAIEQEQFETAADLRDRIKVLE